MPFRRRGTTREFATVDELVAALRRQLATAGEGSRSSEALRGQLAGAESSERATLPCDPSRGSRTFQAGVHTGALHAHLIRTIGSLSWDAILATAAYAAALVTAPAERYMFQTPPNLLQTHLHASLRAAERGDLPFDVELATFRWLAERLSVPVSAELGAQFEDARQRRLSLIAARASERAMDPSAAAEARVERRLRAEVRALERQLAAAEPDSTQADRLQGALAGLPMSSGSAHVGVTADDGASQAYREGLVGGQLLAALLRDDRNPGNRLRSICYRYGAALATSKARTLLDGDAPTNVLKAHALGMFVIRERAEAAIEEDLEIALLGWLAGQLDVPLTPELMSDRHRFVARPATPRG